MTRTIQRLADRMVARLVPATKAAAISCWQEQVNCYQRSCCTGAEVPGGRWCSAWNRVC
ncbi:hypothetical protein [Microbispora rosea]|uniref:hypothetical protein n=1 Tax=Microbispora rosea TaxID=58117 RepID=UPI00343A155A